MAALLPAHDRNMTWCGSSPPPRRPRRRLAPGHPAVGPL